MLNFNFYDNFYDILWHSVFMMFISDHILFVKYLAGNHVCHRLLWTFQEQTMSAKPMYASGHVMDIMSRAEVGDVMNLDLRLCQ